MKRLIDANMLINALEQSVLKDKCREDEPTWNYSEVLEMIDKEPTVEAVTTDWIRQYMDECHPDSPMYRCLRKMMHDWSFEREIERREGRTENETTD